MNDGTCERVARENEGKGRDRDESGGGGGNSRNTMVKQRDAPAPAACLGLFGMTPWIVLRVPPRANGGELHLFFQLFIFIFIFILAAIPSYLCRRA